MNQRSGWLALNNGPQAYLFWQVDKLAPGSYRLYLGWTQSPAEYLYQTRAECFLVLRLIRNVGKEV